MQIDKYWEVYQEELGFEKILSKFRQKKAKEILESIQNPSLRILEIGCGFTPVVELYSDFRSYLAIEPGSDPFSFLENFARDDDRVTVRKGFFSDLEADLEGSEFDAILMSGVLTEGTVADESALLSGASRLMAPSGVMYVGVPNANSMHRILGREMGVLRRLDEPSEVQHSLGVRKIFDAIKLEAVITAAVPDANIIDSGSFFVKPFTHSQLEAARLSDILNDDVFEALFSVSRLFPNYGAELFSVFTKGNKEIEPAGSNPG
jgi:hypothetical protein